MEELLELKSYLERGRYSEALTLIGEMEEMSRDDKINKIRSYMVILLFHLIKRHAEGKTTRSWEVSIKNSLSEIHYTNVRRKAAGTYLSEDELRETLDEAWPIALRGASLEAFGGRYDESQLDGKIDKRSIKQEALRLILETEESDR
jgi:hypothetical protein